MSSILYGVVPEDVERLLPTDHRPHERFGSFLVGAHFFFDDQQIIGSKWVGEVEIVIEPVVNCGSDREFHVRVEFLNRLRHQVGGRMSHPGELECTRIGRFDLDIHR